MENQLSAFIETVQPGLQATREIRKGGVFPCRKEQFLHPKVRQTM